MKWDSHCLSKDSALERFYTIIYLQVFVWFAKDVEDPGVYVAHGDKQQWNVKFKNM